MPKIITHPTLGLIEDQYDHYKACLKEVSDKLFSCQVLESESHKRHLEKRRAKFIEKLYLYAEARAYTRQLIERHRIYAATVTPIAEAMSQLEFRNCKKDCKAKSGNRGFKKARKPTPSGKEVGAFRVIRPKRRAA